MGALCIALLASLSGASPTDLVMSPEPIAWQTMSCASSTAQDTDDGQFIDELNSPLEGVAIESKADNDWLMLQLQLRNPLHTILFLSPELPCFQRRAAFLPVEFLSPSRIGDLSSVRLQI